MALGQTSFNNRISRVEAGQDGLIVGRSRLAKQPNFLFGFISGIVAYLGFVVGAWHLNDWAAVNFTTAGQLGIIFVGTLAIAWLLRALLRLHGKNVVRNQLLGMIVAFGTFHMAVHAFPDEVEMAFAPEWREQTLASTEADFLTPGAGFLAARDVIIAKLETMEIYQQFKAELEEELQG